MNTWQSRLAAGDSSGAWSEVERAHGRVIRAVIRRLVGEPDQAEDAFAFVTAALAADDLARLRRYSREDPSGASLTTWLVVVVRRLVIDWLRHQHGRVRNDVPTDLDGWRRAMYIARCLERLTAAETYEVLHARSDSATPFPAFLRELRALARTHPCPEARPARSTALVSLPEDLAVVAPDPGAAADQARQLAILLDTLAPDVRLAIQLFVVEELEAADVARLVGWPNAKSVYNRVGRALASLRQRLARAGITARDI